MLSSLFSILSVLAISVNTAFSDERSVIRTALQDKLYQVAEKHARELYQKGNQREREEVLPLLFQSYAGQERYADILRFLTDAERRSKGENAPAPSLRPMVAYWKARALLMTGKTGEAIKVAEQALPSAPPSFQEALMQISAQAKEKAGDPKSAWRYFEKIENTTANSSIRAENALEWASSLHRAGRDEEALRVLLRQKELKIRSEAMDNGTLLRGKILLKQGKRTDASLIFTQLAMDERTAEQVRVQAFLEMSVDAWAGGKREEAVAYARNAFTRAGTPESLRIAGFRLGDLLVATEKDPKEGIAIIKKLVRQFPEAPESAAAQLKLADSLLQTGKMEQAALEYKIYLETYPSSPNDAKVMQGRGWALFKLGHFNEAVNAFRSAAEFASEREDRIESLLKEGDALMAAKRFEEAAALYAKLEQDEPADIHAPRALFQSANALERSGRKEEAIKVYLKISEKYFGKDVAPLSLLRVAALQADLSQFDAAIRTYSSVLARFQDQSVRMDALMGRGKTCYRIYQFEKAMSDFASIVENDPKQRDEARFMLTLCLYGVGRDKESRIAAQAFLTDFPESPRLQDMTLWLGKFEFNHGAFSQAQHLFSSYATRWPEAKWADSARLWSARSAFFRNDFTGCVEGISKMILSYPKTSRLNEATLLQADALIELARFDEAVLLLDRIINTAPESEFSIQALLRKGDCLYTMGADNGRRYEEALKSYKACLGKGSFSAATLLQINFKIAWCYEKMKLLDEAVNYYYTEVLLRYQEERKQGTWFDDISTSLCIRAAFRTAEIYERLDKSEQALNVLRRLVRMNIPGSEEARQRIERLKSKKVGI